LRNQVNGGLSDDAQAEIRGARRPVVDREYTIGVTGPTGSAQDNVNDLGVIVGSLGF